MLYSFPKTIRKTIPHSIFCGFVCISLPGQVQVGGRIHVLSRFRFRFRLGFSFRSQFTSLRDSRRDHWNEIRTPHRDEGEPPVGLNREFRTHFRKPRYLRMPPSRLDIFKGPEVQFKSHEASGHAPSNLRVKIYDNPMRSARNSYARLAAPAVPVACTCVTRHTHLQNFIDFRLKTCRKCEPA